MTPELDRRLCADFPLLYRDRLGSPMETSMCWGFPGDGWHPLIRRASEALERALAQWYAQASPAAIASGAPRAAQVKEKFGSLRFYLSDVPDDLRDEVDAIVREAEEASARVCAVCGAAKAARERCGKAHPEAPSAAAAIYGLPMDGRGRVWIDRVVLRPSPPPHHAELAPVVVLALARASDRDFSAGVTGGAVAFAPAAAARLRWTAGKYLDWLGPDGALQLRVVGPRFPVEVFVPSVHPPPDTVWRIGEAEQAHRLRLELRAQDEERFFGERWAELKARRLE